MGSCAEVVWAPAAERDLGRAHAYLRARSPKAARRLAARVLEAIDLLSSQPMMGAEVAGPAWLPAYRRLSVGNYYVYYRIAEGTLYIARFWDARQAPESLWLPGEE